MLRILLTFLLSAMVVPALAAGPTVTVTLSPSYTITTPATVTVNVKAVPTDDVGVNTVVLYRNDVVVSTPPGEIYSITQSGLTTGTYVYKAVATDQNGVSKSDSKTLYVTASNPPTVTLATPTGPFIGPATVPLTATASDSDGTVARVDFLMNNAVIGSDSTSPYSVNWTNVPPGTYSVMAAAYDNTGTRAFSAPVTVFVNAKPTATMVTPSANQVQQAGASFVMSATAEDVDDGIDYVEFWVDGKYVAKDHWAAGSYDPNGHLIQTFSHVYSNTVAGSYTVQAKVYDNSGSSTFSAPVTFQINAQPSVSLTSPVNEATAAAPASFSLQATASDPGGSIASVSFYVDGALKSTDTSAPYAYTWATSDLGLHTIEAIATDNQAGIGAATAFVTVTPPAASSTTLLSRKYVYNSAQELCKVIEPETGSTVTQYDNAGNAIWSAAGLDLPDTTKCNGGTLAFDSGHRVDRTYDVRNRVTSVSFPDGKGDLTYTYEPDGQVKAIAVDNGGNGTDIVTTTYTHNRRGLLTREVMQYNAVVWPIDYAYNAAGHLASQTYHGLAVDYAPNALGQPTKAGTYASGVTYHPNGGIKQFTYGNGLIHTMTQNARGLPRLSCDTASVTSPGTCNVGAFLNDTYDYDANGNVMAITDGRIIAGVSHRGDRDMAYDGLDRLLSVVSPMYSGLPDSKAIYSYDVLDNLTHVVAPGRNHYYCYDADWRLTNLMTGPGCTGTTVMGLGYDLQGNLSNRSGRPYAFDFGNRLRTVGADTFEGKPDSAYVYDGLGLRVRDYVGAFNGKPAGNKYSQYSKAGQVLQASDSRSGVFSEYVYLGGSLVAIRERTGTSGAYVYATKYQHTDALGSPVAVSDANKGVVELVEYEPYGQVLKPLPIKDGPGFTGHVLDAATGLNYMQQRYYDPVIGRFVSSDPVAVHVGPGETGWNFNRYWYANNNPYRVRDPDGREAPCVTIGNCSVDGRNVLPNLKALEMAVLSAILCFGCDLDAVNAPGDDSIQPIVTPMELGVAGASARILSAVSSDPKALVLAASMALGEDGVAADIAAAAARKEAAESAGQIVTQSGKGAPPAPPKPPNLPKPEPPKPPKVEPPKSSK